MTTKKQKEAGEIVNKLLDSNMYTLEEMAINIGMSVSQLKSRKKDNKWRNKNIDKIIELNMYAD